MNGKINRVLRLSPTCLAVLYMCAAAAQAQPVDLAKVVPEGTLFYLSRGGDDHINYVSQHTAFGMLLKEPQMKEFLDGLFTSIDKLAMRELRDNDRPTYEAGMRVLNVLSRRPVAFAVIDGGVGEHGPFVEAALLVDLGKGREKFVEDFEKLLEATNVPPAESATVAGKSLSRVQTQSPLGALLYGEIDGHFVVALGESTVEKIVAGLSGSADSLADGKSLKLSRERIRGNPDGRAYSLYIDVAGLLERTKAAMPALTGGQPASRVVTGILEGIANSGLQSICWELQYNEDGCYSGLFLHSSKEGGGFFSMAPAKPLTDADLAMIPKEPSWAMACNIDLAAFYEHCLGMIKSFDEGTYDDIAAEIKKLEARLGFELSADLFSKIGDTVVLYDAPENGGVIFTGAALVMESSDSQGLRKSIHRTMEAIVESVGDDSVSIASRQYLNHAIDYLKVSGVPMPFAPAWTAHEGYVIGGLYPQVVIAVLDRMMEGGSKSESLLANLEFIKGRKVIGELGSTLSYSDTKAAVEKIYPFILLLGNMAAGMAAETGFEFDMSAFPTGAVMTRHLFPDISTSRSVKDGVLFASYGPFPFGSQSLLTSNFATSATLASVLLPSLSRARELSKRTVCAANLRGIGQAMYIYANDNNDKFPPDFTPLIDDNYSTERQFVCPSSNARIGDLNACYEYITGQTAMSDPTNVLLYEKKGCHQNEGGNVLFQDGHVEFVKPYSRVEELVKETRERLEKEKKK